jgi:CRP-like cAMP-binding protein
LREIINEILDDPAFLEGIAWKMRCFDANEIVIRAGEASKYIFLISEGIFRVTVHVKLERRKSMRPGICDLTVGDIFGETCLLEWGVPNASVIAITGGSAVEIDAEKLNVYLDANPLQGYVFFKKLFVILVERLHRSNQRVESLLAWGLKAYEIEKHF